MESRARIWSEFAQKHPGAFWGTESAVFYGLVALGYDLGQSMGWPNVVPWPAQLFAAVLFGWYRLHVTRRHAFRSGPGA